MWGGESQHTHTYMLLSLLLVCMRRQWARANHMTFSFVTSGKPCPGLHLTGQLSTSSAALLLFRFVVTCWDSFNRNLCVFSHALLPGCVSSPRCNSWRIQRVTGISGSYQGDTMERMEAVEPSLLCVLHPLFWVPWSNQSMRQHLRSLPPTDVTPSFILRHYIIPSDTPVSLPASL